MKKTGQGTVYIYNSQNALYEVFKEKRCYHPCEVFEVLEGSVYSLYKVNENDYHLLFKAV